MINWYRELLNEPTWLSTGMKSILISLNDTTFCNDNDLERSLKSASGHAFVKMKQSINSMLVKAKQKYIIICNTN